MFLPIYILCLSSFPPHVYLNVLFFGWVDFPDFLFIVVFLAVFFGVLVDILVDFVVYFVFVFWHLNFCAVLSSGVVSLVSLHFHQ